MCLVLGVLQQLRHLRAQLVILLSIACDTDQKSSIRAAMQYRHSALPVNLTHTMIASIHGAGLSQHIEIYCTGIVL